MLRCVVGQNVDMVFEVLHDLVKFFLGAVELSVDLHLRGYALASAGLDMGQVNMFLLQQIHRDKDFKRRI